MTIRRQSKGFTLIELMIATATFSLLLLVVMGALIFIGRLYYKGVTEAKTQEIARTVIERVSQSVQFSGTPVHHINIGADGWEGAYCIGSKKYSYKTNVQLVGGAPAGTGQANQVLVESDDPSCQAATNPAPAANPTELLNDQMRLTRFEIAPNNGLVNVRVGVVYGGNPSEPAEDATLFEISGGVITACRTGAPGSNFCAVANLSTAVFRKVD